MITSYMKNRNENFFFPTGQYLEDKGFVAFAFLNVVWASIWLEAWKRKSAALAFRWGTLDSHQEVFADPRPQFKGELQICSVTGRLLPHYPSWKRNLTRYLVTLPLLFLSLVVVFYVMIFVLRFQDSCEEFLVSHNLPTILKKAPKMIMAIPIGLFNKWYTKLAYWLNDKENYRTEEAYQNHLIVKLLLLRFVNSFLSLFYIAFYIQDLTRLREQLAALLLMKQLTGNFKESLVPYLKKRLQQAKLSHDLFGALKKDKSPKDGQESYDSDDSDDEITDSQAGQDLPDGDRRISQVEVECKMGKYDGTFKDYLEMFIQFGYVTLFSPAFPLAAAFAVVSNFIEIRSDAFKMCYVLQRPFGERAQSIGVWQDAMELMGVLSIIVNCAMIGMSGHIQHIYPNISIIEVILLMVLLEHILIALKYGISYAIPDVPEWIENKMAKIEFQRREALKTLEKNFSKKKD
ncbi:Anoctamin-8 [Halocaridina rubra]|uniref:Anoctamin n=1 Tax=Halocaridina rubra TaxID=373956 RepID=A0AAN8WRK6_HALRR